MRIFYLCPDLISFHFPRNVLNPPPPIPSPHPGVVVLVIHGLMMVIAANCQ
jgi:hypothetical protein